MTNHFDYFRFYEMLIVIYCNEQDEILGSFTLRNGNEFGQLFVAPSHRGTEVVHLLIREAVAIVTSLGFPSIWGVGYGRMRELLQFFARKTNVEITVEEEPDGRWQVEFQTNQGPISVP